MEPDKEAAEIVSQMFLWAADGNTVAKQEKKLRALQDNKRKLYERYALGEIDLDSYKAEKEKYDIALVGEKNTHAMITARAKRAQGDYEANLKHQDLAKEIGSSTTLTKSLVDTLINKIYIFKDERIEIDYAVRDFFENETTQEMPSCGARDRTGCCEKRSDLAPNGFANFFVFRLTYACRTSRSCATVTLPRTPPPPRTRHHNVHPGTHHRARVRTRARIAPMRVARHFDTRVTLS